MNITHREFVQLGTVGSARRAVVDPRGLVTPWPHGWSLDWWIGAEDRWHLPARESAVRQQRLGAAPVIETAMRVPGGDAVHRAYATQTIDGEFVVIEIENRSAVPFAAALAVRPYNILGDAPIDAISIDGEHVTVGGLSAVLLPKPAARIAAACEDVCASVVAGRAVPPTGPTVVSCHEGQANAALVFPLAHTATLRVLLPLVPSRARSAGGAVSTVASAEQVARGWMRQVERSTRLELPDDRLTRTLSAARHDLLLFHAGEELVAWPGRRLSWTDAARVLDALGQLGHEHVVEQVLLSVPDDQRLDGWLGAEGDDWSANGAVLRAFGRHWALTRDPSLVDRCVGPIAKAVHWIEKRRTARRRRFLDRASDVDAFWSISGLLAVAPALRAAGQPEVSDDAADFAARLMTDVEKGLVADPDPVAPLIGATLGLLAADDERVAVSAAQVVDRAAGALGPHLTLDLALVELLLGDGPPLDRVAAAGEGHDAGATAAFCSFMRTMLVREQPAGLVLCSLVPDTWLGQGWEVHGLPTEFGRLGFVVRWHGDRPALLWELERHDDGHPVQLTAPGLDPHWSSTESRGEALLARRAPRHYEPRADGGSAEASSSFA